MTIRARLDGVERDINDIEPILRDIDRMSDQVLSLLPSPDRGHVEAGSQNLAKLKALYDPLIDRITIVRRWNEQQDHDFAESLRLFALDWKKSRP